MFVTDLVYGYMGTILRINLTTRTVKKKQLDNAVSRKYLGGRGLGAKILFDEVGPRTEAFSPDNELVLCTGPVTGCLAPGANRFVIITKSPQTGFFLDTYAGGNFGPELKFAGYDALIVSGRGEAPVYVYINDNDVSIRDASHLWGKDCWETEDLLKKELGDRRVRVAVIGPAGEKLVKYAIVSTDYFHQCGRGGAGAVMGAKNLKGIAVLGTKAINIFNPDELVAFMSTEIERKFTSGPAIETVKSRMKYGTPLTMNFTQEVGILPTRNFTAGQFEKSDHIDGHAMREKIVVSDKSCYSCSVACLKYSLVKSGRFTGGRMVGPEYETNAMLGSNLGIDDISAILEANVMCDRLGIDTISAGNVIGFAIECYQKGILTKEETGGLELSFGNVDSVVQLIPKIANREGVGAVLADGVAAAARKFGKGAERFAMSVKGMEYPAYEPRGSPAFALLYAITDRGACHRRGWPTIVESRSLKPFTAEGRATLVKKLYDDRIPLHCGLVCDFPYMIAGIGTDYFARILSAITGWDIGVGELQLLSERVASLVRAFNIREGASRADDILALRSMEEPLVGGPYKGRFVTSDMLNQMLDEYYDLRGWDRTTGTPTKETLNKLGLEYVANQLSGQSGRGSRRA